MDEYKGGNVVTFSWRGVHRGPLWGCRLGFVAFGCVFVPMALLVLYAFIADITKTLLTDGLPLADVAKWARVAGITTAIAVASIALYFWIQGVGAHLHDYWLEIGRTGIRWSRGDHEVSLGWKEIAGIQLATDWSGLRPHVVFRVVEARDLPMPPHPREFADPTNWGIAGGRSELDDVIEALERFGGMRRHPERGKRVLLADIERLELPGNPSPLGELPRSSDKAYWAVLRWVWENRDLFAERDRAG